MKTPSDYVGSAEEPSDCTRNSKFAESLEFEGSANLEFDAEAILEQVLADPAVSHFLLRHQFETQETLSTYVRCEFAAEQQRYILHVPFYPHFSSIPQVTATIFDDNAGRIRVTDQQKYGTRIEITLNAPTPSPLKVLVEVIAAAQTSVHPDL